MVGFMQPKRTPIGVDLGSRVVKLAQLSADHQAIVETGRWDLPIDLLPGAPNYHSELVNALRQARDGKKFRGRDAIVSLSARDVHIQNVRVTKAEGQSFEQAILQETVPRLPFPATEAELRWVEAGDVRQGEQVRREVIVLAVHRPVLDQMLQVIEDAGLWPVAVEVEPQALLRVYDMQYRRDADSQVRTLFVHVGNASTLVTISQATELLFVKNIELGGRHFDDAVARHLNMPLGEAWALRRHNGDRRADQQDPDIARSVTEATRPVIEKLISEVSLCIRYHSVTFRGQPLKRLVVAGGEATSALIDALAARLDLKCELGDPLRTFDPIQVPGRRGQWDLAVGLALRPMK